jgi:DNA-binding response OmpR family regulator
MLYLEPMGLELATARTLEEARTLIARGQFDLAVLDWDRAEGVDLVHLSKTQHPDIPIIVCTGGDRADGLLEGGLAREAEAVVNRKGSLGTLTASIFRHLKPRETRPRSEGWVPRMCATGSAGAA